MRLIHIAMSKVSRVLLYLWAFTAVACSLTPSIPMIQSGTQHDVGAFMGISFGDSMDQVQRRFPTGLIQTSPYGAPAYKLENVSSRNIEYRDVIYEFEPHNGMQMVIAHFVPSASADLYQQLQSTLGVPVSTGAGIDEGSASAEATWRLPDGSRVLFNEPFHRLVLIGKDGGSLETDIRLRDQYIPIVS